MRSPSDEIFRLIKSMTGAEKGYFKKKSAKHWGKNDSKYIELFEVMIHKVKTIIMTKPLSGNSLKVTGL